MPRRSNAQASPQLHVVPLDDDYEVPTRTFRSVDARSEPWGELINIDSARGYRQSRNRQEPPREPAMLAKWAVGLSVVMFLAALTSGQA